MGNARILLFHVHENIPVVRHVGGPEQVEKDARGMPHDDRMALLESDIGQKPESQPFIEGDGNQFVADPDADVIDLRYIEHWLDIAMGMSLQVAVDYIR